MVIEDFEKYLFNEGHAYFRITELCHLHTGKGIMLKYVPECAARQAWFSFQ